MIQNKTTIIRASWLCPVDRPPIQNGCVVVAGGKIRFVGPFDVRPSNLQNSVVEDLGEGAIIPGLVNAHTHLEFSDLSKPLGEAGINFTDWIRLVVGHRKQDAVNSDQKSKSILSGIQESFAAGVWAIGEIATQPVLANVYSQASHQTPVHCTVFLEQLGRSSDRLQTAGADLVEHLGAANSEGSAKNKDQGFACAASPHAPYSVQWQLFDQICEAARGLNVPVAMHLAETMAERQLLESLTGDFVGLLQDFGVWDPESFYPRRSIKGFLGRLSQAPRSLIVHGNYLTDDELDIVGRNKNMSVVYCPRTHHFFGHEAYRLAKMRDRGINVAVGTDSRASNPDLNLFQEMKMVSSKFPELTVNDVLKMGTVNAATALGVEDRFGTLAVNKTAACSFVAQPDGSPANLSAWLFSEETTAKPVVVSADGSAILGLGLGG